MGSAVDVALVYAAESTTVEKSVAVIVEACFEEQAAPVGEAVAAENMNVEVMDVDLLVVSE